ncbi:MAG: hypothetical protein QOE98_1142 [Gaiellaceae bacterium]|nr:hypothetical protein [Gaiellaceae bacterium]
MRLRRPVAIRTRLLGAVLLAAVVILVALVAGFNIALRATLDGDATSVAQARAAAVLPSLEIAAGQVQSREAPDDTALDALVWVYDGTRLVEGPQASTSALDAAARAAAVDAPAVREAGGLRLASAVIASNGGPIGAVVAGVPLAPYEATTRTVLIASITLATVLFVAIALLAAWTLRRALRPVHEMTHLAGEWSERDPNRRFAQGPPHDELTDLAATLDQLLGRLSASLSREQRFSAELAHELRTPLARIAAESELALRTPLADADAREAFAAIGRSAEEMRRTIEVLVAAARHAAGHQRGVTDTAQLLASLARHASAVESDRGIEIRTRNDGPTRIAVDVDLATRIIEPVIVNALLYAATRVTLAASGEDGSVVVVVEDDGPGVTPGERERIFNPGERGSAARGSGAGLGLSLARRLATDVSGSIELVPSTSGARFRIRLPRA